MYEIIESKTFRKLKIEKKLYNKIREVIYPQLRNNPAYGSNIKRLKGNSRDYHRYRLGSYRLFYMIKNEHVVVSIVDLKHRQNSYKK
ncbi:MAG: Addiction module toxin, RelE/StbE family [uncultured Campylobacterales bacterium]|uniref:Addiction module toxin, RelE/StbE family n=1 Tax=uncultured Campylobacterales bacterium TaxID=352960 RepID=A0A6S6SR68_9BACT|nr:MAG: Addiction module toxin, RelE/StbE family [uncultured Campylobacterales bacterium]